MLTITNEDNMAMMSRYADNYFDLAIVDPPYGININMNAGRRKDTASKKRTVKKWDDCLPEPSYFTELMRVSKNQIIWGGNYFGLPTTSSWIFWDKLIAKGVSFGDGELAWTSFDSVLRKVTCAYSGFIGADEDGRFHPTQKPIKLYEILLQNYAQKGFKILDTHLGSGSIAIACYNEGYDLTACELDKEYFEDAMKRIEIVTQQIRMF